MPDTTTNPTHWDDLLQRFRAGDLAARDELFGLVGRRMEKLARRLLRNFPSVRRWNDTDDIVQSALMRLLRALEQVQPTTLQDFVNLAALLIRRVLLDLARRLREPYRQEALRGCPHDEEEAQGPGLDPVDVLDDPHELDRWFYFHQAVERLPVEEREVVGLVFYHGWTQTEVAELFHICERTVRRRWDSALLKLRSGLGER